jgi:hypothetical protein
MTLTTCSIIERLSYSKSLCSSILLLHLMPERSVIFVFIPQDIHAFVSPAYTHTTPSIYWHMSIDRVAGFLAS